VASPSALARLASAHGVDLVASIPAEDLRKSKTQIVESDVARGGAVVLPTLS
jgi:hypothetical protein